MCKYYCKSKDKKYKEDKHKEYKCKKIKNISLNVKTRNTMVILIN
jgi:hypothetical protein